MDESMNNFIVSDWFDNRPEFSDVIIEGITFPLASLSDEIKELIKECETSADMLEMAADNALAYNRERVAETSRADDLKLFWSLKEIDTGVEPSIKHQVGEAVIKLSEITDTLQDKIDEEESTELDADAAGSQENLAEDVEKLLQDKNHSMGQ